MENCPASTGKNNEKLGWNKLIDQKERTSPKSPDPVESIVPSNSK